MILDILQPKANSLLCPKCERPLEDHDEDRCKRKMSRRFFLGAATGVVLAAAIPATKTTTKIFHGIDPPLPSSWFPGGRYMLSAREGYFVSSLRDHGVNKNEVDYLTRQGFDVYVTDDEQAAKFEYYKKQKELARLINEERFGAMGSIDEIATIHPDKYRKIQDEATIKINTDILGEDHRVAKRKPVHLSTTDTSHTSLSKEFIKKQLEKRGFVVA